MANSGWETVFGNLAGTTRDDVVRCGFSATATKLWRSIACFSIPRALIIALILFLIFQIDMSNGQKIGTKIFCTISIASCIVSKFPLLQPNSWPQIPYPLAFDLILSSVTNWNKCDDCRRGRWESVGRAVREVASLSGRAGSLLDVRRRTPHVHRLLQPQTQRPQPKVPPVRQELPQVS